jgi:hypothetical protein
MEVIGRRWTIAHALIGSLPGLALMLMAHRAGDLSGVLMVGGPTHGLHSAGGIHCHARLSYPSSSRRHCAGAGIFSVNRSRGSLPAAWDRF